MADGLMGLVLFICMWRRELFLSVFCCTDIHCAVFIVFFLVHTFLVAPLEFTRVLLDRDRFINCHDEINTFLQCQVANLSYVIVMYLSGGG